MSYAGKYPRVAHIGNRVSHAKNRTKHAFKYNLHTVTLIVNGVRQRMLVPTRVLRKLKASGMTTHFKKETAKEAKKATSRAKSAKRVSKKK